MTAFNRIKNWRPRTPFYYGWIVVGVAALGTYAATGSTQLVLGGIQTLILEDMGWERSTIAFAATAGTWASGLMSPLIGRLADKYGPRGLMPAAVIVTGLCYFVIAGMNSVWQFYAGFIIARALGNPVLVGVVPRTIAVNFFQRKRNFVLGITSMWRPLGGAINIQLFTFIAQLSSWRVAYSYLGAFGLILTLPLFILTRRQPEDIGLRPDGDTELPSRTNVETQRQNTNPRTVSGAKPQFDWTVKEAVLTSTFWVITLVQVFEILVGGAVNFQIVPMFRDAGISLAIAAGALSLGSLLGAVGNPIVGFLSDRFSPRSMAIGMLLASMVVMALFLVTPVGPLFFIVYALWGAVAGGLGILSAMMMAQYFGRRSYGSIIGLVGPLQTGALGVGPTVGALLFDYTGSYTVLWFSGVVAYALAFLLILVLRTPKLPQRAYAEGFASDD